jgi:hypothetical protein
MVKDRRRRIRFHPVVWTQEEREKYRARLAVPGPLHPTQYVDPRSESHWPEGART